MSAEPRPNPAQGHPSRADRFRWLLTALGAPAFVRLYVEPCQTRRCVSLANSWPLRLYEAAFFSLAPTSLHPEEGRVEAWRHLAEAVESDWLDPAAFFAVALRCVLAEWESTAEIEGRAEYRELASSGGVLDLLMLGAVRKSEPKSGYVEVHVHKDGCVPYDWLWEKWMDGDRLRPSVNIRYPIEQSTVGAHLGMGTWQTTYAELLSTAANCRKKLRRRGSFSVNEVSLLCRFVRSRRSVPAVRAAAYLSIYIGIRRSMIYQRGVSGLAMFSNFFGTVGELRKPSAHPDRNMRHEQIVASMTKFCEQGAVAVELRPMLSGPALNLRRTLDDLIAGFLDYLARQPEGSKLPRFGIVFSLRKDPHFRKNDDLANAKLWERQTEQWCDQVKLLFALLDDNDLYRYFVVGIDAAGQEQGCPPRALQRPLQLIRKYNKELKTCLPGRRMDDQTMNEIRAAAQHPGKLGAVAELLRSRGVPLIRLGVTVHAGEDFVDPMTGLRHIWETVDHLGLRKGDRLGHALASALAPNALKDLLNRRFRPSDSAQGEWLTGDRWRLRKPRGVHLLDLAWEWNMRNQGHSGEPKPIERQLVEAQLRSVSMSAHGSPVDSERFLKAVGNSEHPVRVLLPSVHFKDPAFLAPEDYEWVILDEEWLKRFESMRQKVLGKLRTCKIAVESCPTSNQRIGNLSQPPLSHLHAALGDLTLIATDDPGMFDAWPQDELAKFSELRDQLLENNRNHSFIQF